jgi:hypothetical protein
VCTAVNCERQKQRAIQRTGSAEALFPTTAFD